jgi:2-oxoglutarate ferredoxin oxidoreductase subunit alpha
MADLNIIIAGAAGQGVQSAGEILGKTLLRLGFYVYATQDYQSRVRGGHNFMRIRFGDRPLIAQVRHSNYLLALNEESLRLHLPDLDPQGLALCMTDDQGAVDDPRIRALADEVGPRSARGEKFVGVKLLSLLFTALGFGPATLSGAVQAEMGKRLKPELLQANLEAIAAVAAVVAKGDVHPLPFGPDPSEPRMLVSGNDAISLGMVAGGVGVYASYPMTPASSIMESLAAFGPRVGVAVEQTEDEIAALNLAIGAAYAGARAAAGSSGAGMCLMSEAMGLAGITETPVVIIDGQRPGPAVGMATRTEQSDLLFLVHASQGEFPRAILAPADHADGFYLAAEAFNLAERWHIPVFLMDDQAYADALRSVPEFDVSRVKIDRGPLAPEPETPQVLRRYEVTESGVSPRAYPALSKWIVCCDSHEHDEYGRLTDNLQNRDRQNHKRMKKLDGIAAEFPGPEIVGDPDGTLLLCWGSTVGPVLEALEQLRGRGHRLGVAIFRHLFPVNAPKVQAALSPAKRLITIEMNYRGQLGQLLRMEAGIATHGHIGKTDGRGFTVEDVVARVEPLLGGAS